jgi:diguanylate cyclase (GGDEF)-like protein
MAQGLLMFDPDGKLAVSNRRFAEMFGVPWEQWNARALGMTVRQAMQLSHELNKTVTQKYTPEIIAAVKDMLNDHTARRVLVERTDGRVFDASMAPKPNGGFVVTFDDITERRRYDEKISHMAHYDMLTDLPNRASFAKILDATLDRAADTGNRFAVLSIDLDHFKEANDTYGHMVGDRMLCEIAGRLKAAAGEAFVARFGGDEFAVIGADGEQPAAAAALAERLLATFKDDFEVQGHRSKLGMSIGIAIYPTGGADAKILMTSADAALYRAKAEARGTALFFQPEMSARLHERYALQEDLRLAIDRGELLLHYQPQFKMSGEVVGFEALARWQSPKHGMVPPGTFIPIAEESSLIISLGEWVLREACREAASWSQPLTIAVNISPIQFRHGDLPRLVHSILLETGLSPGRLELEITENVLVNDFSRAVSILNRLKSLGVRIAMDDFGTGYSSLSYLHSFVCDKIKIDRVFIYDLEQNHHSRSIVRAVIGLGRSLDLPILAEGVETEGQHAFLVQEECDEVQGYLTGRPLPIDDYAKLVGRRAVVQKSYAVAG